ncbi:hypothetical protein OESDEN_05383 [Oesophagostomum dentatum]|uniref:Uncharacterized protein n=1 Tax=Oesophagostomum dentatum TaxID=61180 RepID=A0A0B1TBQ7_OESDE|nr:hypothetical protein OESDEN_05383 [Oesophagostomum dentatum]
MKTVAEKWYGFEETDLHRIIVDDIGDYVQGAFTRGEKFNVILIDLCANERRPLICPTEEISGSDVVENLATILTDAGESLFRS